jgi:hypothetical protein
MTNETEVSRADLDKYQNRALLLAGFGLLLCIAGALLNPVQFFHSYLFAFLFWFGISLGSLGILMLHHLVGGTWGFVIQRFLETAARLLPLMALLFIPLLIGIPYLYEWSHDEAMSDVALQHKSPYLNVPFFVVRAALYFAVWIFLAYQLTRWSRRADETGDPELINRMERLSGPGLVIYGLTMTFAAIDWAMSLEPHWYSTIFGMVFLVGQALSAIGFAIILAYFYSHRKPLVDVITPKQFHDLGNLLLALVMLWAYIAFSQFLIIWSGNIAEEVTWYASRMHGGWNVIALLLITFHFGVPFLLLLQRRSKRRTEILSGIAFALLALRLVDLFWIVSPALHREGFFLHWTDLVAPVAIGALWLAAFIWLLKDTRLLPTGDPRLVVKTIPHSQAAA